ncbi:TIGR00725 family protein [Bacteroidota bacterium]
MKKIQIAVLGSSKAICSKKAYDMAVKVGEELANNNCTVITGGGMGIMEAALKGAKKKSGLTVAIIPWESMKIVNDYADVVIATGIGWSRNSINLNSCDGAIVIEGGAGTLNEATYAYIQNKPIVALESSGGTAKELANRYLDKRKTQKIYGESTPESAVKKILKLAIEYDKATKLSKLDQELMEMEKNANQYLNKNKRKK